MTISEFTRSKRVRSHGCELRLVLSERGAAWWRQYLNLGPDDPIPPGCAEPVFDEQDLFLDVDLDGDE